MAALLLTVAITISLICGACISHPRRDDINAENKKAIELTLEWARLAPFPPSARDVTIKVEGGFFTRAFRSHFKASKDDIDVWVKQSPGLMDAASTYADGKRKYTIRAVLTAPRSQAEMMMQLKSMRAGVECST